MDRVDLHQKRFGSMDKVVGIIYRLGRHVLWQPLTKMVNSVLSSLIYYYCKSSPKLYISSMSLLYYYYKANML